MPSVTVRPNEPDEYVIPTTASPEGEASLQYVREYQTTTKLLLDVPRDEAASADLDKFDTVRVSGYPDHRIKTVQTGGQNWRIVAYSFEIDGRRDEPLSGGETFEGTDDEIITDLINRSSYWSVGTVQSLTGPLTYIFDDAFLHEALRRVEANTPGELRFNDDGTVDYVESIGTDKSGSVTLSPDAANIDGPLAVVDDGQSDDMDATHIRVMGGHEGNARPRANLIPQDDPQTYENEIRYSTPLWSSSEDTEWGRWTNSDLTQQATLEEEATALADEITDPVIDVATGDSARHGVRGLDLALGDYVTVDKPDADISRPMRIHRIVDKIVGGVKRQAVELSTRTYARDTDRKRTRDEHRQRVGFQGNSVSVQGGGARQPVNSSINAEIPFDYPDLEYEDEAVVQVRGLKYRAYAGGSGAISTSTFARLDEDTLGASVALAPGDQTTLSATIPVDTTAFILGHKVTIEASTNAPLAVSLTRDGTTGDLFSEEMTTGPFDDIFFDAFDPSFSPGDTVTLEIENQSPSTTVTLADTTQVEIYEPRHEHDLIPGIIEQFGGTGQEYTASNVDVIVNGTTVAADIGSGEFETEVDITGELTPDAWNLVELSSDSLGHIQGVISLDGYKQISTD